MKYTVEEIKGMSDKDLSWNITKLIYGEEIENWCLSDCETFIYDCGPIGESFYEVAIKDYCSDWSVTGPLMVEYQVRIVPPAINDNKWMVALEYQRAWNENPLRAICEVILMMESAK